jgi:hypothetical protein
MYNIGHIKDLIGTEIEALLIEVSELKQRVATLEHESFHRSLNVQQHIGQYIDHTEKINGPVL